MRYLSNYRNADGSAPDGKSNGDDTVSLRAALADGPGTVMVGAGNYHWGDICVPAGVTLVGAGNGTIVRSNGAKQIFLQKEVGDWAIRDLVLEGDATGDWHKRDEKGLNGITVDHCWNYEMSDVGVRNFQGAGISMAWNHRPGIGFRYAGSMQRISAIANYTGIRFGERAEYLNASDLACYNNVQGCTIHAGNVKIANSSFVANIDGVIIDDKQNGSHGIINGCMLNHNERYALQARNVQYGMIVSDCAFFYGAILIESCSGVNITDGIISCSLEITGANTNRIAGNYIIPEHYNFKLAPVTIVKDNFTKSGPWEPK